MHFNYVRTFFRFLLPFSFNVFLPPGESNPGHPAYAVGIPQSSFVIMRLYSSHSSLPSVACPLPSSQPSPNVRLPVAVHCLQSNGAPQRRQPGNSIVNASWRHDSRLATTHHGFPPPTLRSSSFGSLLQTFAFRSPSTVWNPRTTSFSEPYKTRVPSRPLFPAVSSNSFKSLIASVAISNFHATSPNPPRSP